jgi:hypothetical protein
MSILQSSPSAANHSASPVTWSDRDAEDFAAYMSCAALLGRLPEPEEFSNFLAELNDSGRYFDEPDEMFDDGPYFSPCAEDLAWLESQRADCEGYPESLAELERDIAAVKAAIAAVAAVL